MRHCSVPQYSAGNHHDYQRRESFDNSKPLIKRQSTHLLPKEGKSPIEHINYRSISLLNIPVKILEKILINRIIQHLEMNNLQNPRQHGFRKNRGTHTATAILSETIAIALGNGNKVNVLCISWPRNTVFR